MLQLQAIRWVFGKNVRHIEERDEGKSRITIDDRNNLMG
jgi:hypothetical protein